MSPKMFTIILLSFLIAGCSPEIELDLGDFEKKLVVYGYFSPNEVMQANVSHIAFSTDNETFRKVEDAAVLVFENGTLYDSLVHVGNGDYISPTNKSPKNGMPYQLEIHHADYPTLITANDTVPGAPSVNINYKLTLDSSNNVHYNLDISAEFSSSSRYLARRIVRSVDEIGRTGNWAKTSNPCSVDGLYYESFICNKLLVDDYTCINSHPNLVNHSYTVYGPDLPDSLKLMLCYVTPLAAEYHLKLSDANLYTDDQSLDLFIEPVFLPQVVENGYGFFGTYNCSNFTIEL